MKRYINALIFSTFLATGIASANSHESGWKKAYPAANKDTKRYVIHLPELADESSAKVQLIIGKDMMTDGVNNYGLMGEIKEANIEGWGYPRYDAVLKNDAISTLIGVPEGTPQVKKFVTLAGNPYLVRYNSKLPIVVYVTDGYELRYKIWKAEPEEKNAPEG